MSSAIAKIKLSPSRDIPFNKLVLSQSNVRRVKACVSIEQLAESIALRTLLQSLSVRPVVDADGAETGMFEVPAGGRRYRALELLVKQKRMAKTQPVPCVVRDGGIAEDDSLAENDERVGLHPLDQFRTFKLLRDGGMSEEDIAARHFVTPAIVKQRLRLASVSPKLHDVYAADDMTLQQLMAFSVITDHERQEQVWDNVSSSQLDEPYQIRRMLTENTVRASDRRAQFIGLDAYEQAGGAVMRDLFEHDDGGWLQDVPLLDRLVTEKLKAEAETIATEGWKWIAVAVDFPYGHSDGLRELDGEPVDLTADEQATLEALNAEYAKIEQDYQDADELPDEIDQRLGEIEAARSAFDTRSLRYDQADIVRAGAFVSIDAEGFLLIDRGYVRPEDEAPEAADPQAETDAEAGGQAGRGQAAAGAVRRAVITVGGAPVEPVDEDDDDTIKPLPDRLITELTAHRTLALRDALANEPAIAFQAVLHNFVLATFYRFASSSGCLEIAIRTPTFPPQAPGLKVSTSAQAIDARHDGWKARLPKDESDLWDALTALDGSVQASLFAHCASSAVNALYEPANRYNEGRVSAHGVRRRLDQADVLARAVSLDMVAVGWKPTVDNYLGRITKPRILEAVREAKGEAALPPHWSKSNPVDILGDAGPARYGAALEALLEGPENDAVLVMNVQTAVASSTDAAQCVADVIKAKRMSAGATKPVLAVWVGANPEVSTIFNNAGIPRFEAEGEAVRGFMHLVRHRSAMQALMEAPPSLPTDFVSDITAAKTIVNGVIADGRTWLDPLEVAKLFEAYAIPFLTTWLARGPDEAEASAAAVIARGEAVVLKILSRDIVHKSDVGGVRLNLTSGAAVRTAAAELLAAARAARPEARIGGLTVQPMVIRPKARELIAGIADDPTFGPIVLFGRGGTAVEVINDKALALPPLDLGLARDLIMRTRVSRILRQYRNVPAVKEDAVALVLVKIAQLAADLPEVKELDINPLLADETGVLSLDARVKVGAVEARFKGRGHPHMAVRPYPAEQERTVVLGDGWRVFVRPVRPDDEERFRSFFAEITQQDLRLRFFAAVKNFDHPFIARLTQLDYARSMAFVALDEETGGMLGVVRLHADANYQIGEYAILLRSDLKGRGLGWALMKLMIAYARSEGLSRVEGEVLRENSAMMKMCRELGFQIWQDPDDPQVSLVKLELEESEFPKAEGSRVRADQP